MTSFAYKSRLYFCTDMPFCLAGTNWCKYIRFQWLAGNKGAGPTAAPAPVDANPTHGVENLYSRAQIAGGPQMCRGGQRMEIVSLLFRR